MVLRLSNVRLGVLTAVVIAGLPLLLSACSSVSGPSFTARNEPWRSAEERACMTSGTVRQTNFLRGRSALNGPSVCGAAAPFEMTGALGGRITLRPAAMLRCPMIPQIERWLADVVEPEARARFGRSVREVTVAASYSCRPINHKVGGRLSEHGYANALDVSAFVLEDGEKITVKGGWNGTPAEREFLRAVHKGACTYFTTVLGPRANRFHADHFHVDLARHGRDGTMRFCR